MKLFCTKCKKVYELNWEGTLMGGQNGAKCKCGYPLSSREIPNPSRTNKYDVGVNTGKKAN